MAFPTTSLLDDFNRADVNPLTGGQWINKAYSAEDANMKIVSLQAANAGLFNGSAYWNASFGPDCEVYQTIPVLTAFGQAFVMGLRFSHPGNDALVTGYQCYFINGASQTCAIYETTATNQTQLASFSISFAAGNQIGFSASGSTLSAWLNTGSGWALVGSHNDTSHAGAGFIVMEIDDAVGRITNFSGGTTVASGHTYYVAPVPPTSNGSDGNTGSISSPWATINHALAAMVGGDSLIMRAGTYTQSIDQTVRSIPNGTSFVAGAGATLIQAFSGESVTIHGYCYLTMNQNLIIDGINFNGAGIPVGPGFGTFEINGGNHIRLTNCSVYNGTQQCILLADNAGTFNNIELTNLIVYNSGQGTPTANPFHGIYISGSVAAPSTNGPVLCDNVEAYNHTSSDGFSISYGIVVYDSNTGIDNNVTVRNCNLHGNGTGLLIGCGANHTAYNNLIWGNVAGAAAGGDGLEIGYGPAGNNTTAYNNTIYGNAGYAVNVAPFGFVNNTTLQNNIYYLNTRGTVLLGAHSGTVNQPSPILTTNPSFVDAMGANFHLLAASAARDIGGNLSATFTTDKDGVMRPASGFWDVGAYQFVSTQSVVSGTDLVSTTGENTNVHLKSFINVSE